jgi:hypothetical protein
MVLVSQPIQSDYIVVDLLSSRGGPMEGCDTNKILSTTASWILALAAAVIEVE